MKKEWIQAFITLLAAAITMVFCFINQYDTLFSLKRLLIVIIVFMIIGSFAKKAYIKIEESTPPPEDMDKKKEQKEDDDAEEDMEGIDENNSDTAENEPTAEMLTDEDNKVSQE